MNIGKGVLAAFMLPAVFGCGIWVRRRKGFGRSYGTTASFVCDRYAVDE